MDLLHRHRSTWPESNTVSRIHHGSRHDSPPICADRLSAGNSYRIGDGTGGSLEKFLLHPCMSMQLTVHAKGGVEGMVGYVRRNYMVPVPRVASFEALNEKLLRDCLDYGGHRVQGRVAHRERAFRERKSPPGLAS
jgi:hypothetical protein